jgi:osmoprotectant transport system permease protein
MDVFVVEHVLISLVPWLAGVVLGGGLGYLCAILAHTLFSSLPGLCKPSMLLPWRAILMSLLLVVLSPASVAILGVGPVAGAAVVGLSMLLLAMPLTAAILLEDWYPSPLTVRLIAGLRTLATASVVVAVGAGVFGGGGLGPSMMESIRLFQFGRALEGWLVILALALMLDLLLGILQLIAFRKSAPRH